MHGAMTLVAGQLSINLGTTTCVQLIGLCTTTYVNADSLNITLYAPPPMYMQTACGSRQTAW